MGSVKYQSGPEYRSLASTLTLSLSSRAAAEESSTSAGNWISKNCFTCHFALEETLNQLQGRSWIPQALCNLQSLPHLLTLNAQSKLPWSSLCKSWEGWGTKNNHSHSNQILKGVYYRWSQDSYSIGFCAVVQISYTALYGHIHKMRVLKVFHL